MAIRPIVLRCIFATLIAVVLAAIYSFYLTKSNAIVSDESAPSSSVLQVAPASQNENLFQKRLDEQKFESSSAAPQVTTPDAAGSDPFKAFLDKQNKNRSEQAGKSPFEK